MPERWLCKGERPAVYDNDRLSASKPFGVGVHSGMGRPLAWVELPLVMTRLLLALDLIEEPAERVDFDAFAEIMLIQKQPMEIRVKVRAGAKYKASTAQR